MNKAAHYSRRFNDISIFAPSHRAFDAAVQPARPEEVGDSTVTPGTAPAQSSGPTVDCACCVSAVSIGNVARIDTPRDMGHSFDVTIALDYPSVGSGRGAIAPCKLEWWEKTNVPGASGTRFNQWTDIYAVRPSSSTFDPWDNRVGQCDTSSAVTISDTPSLYKGPRRSVMRSLEFDIQVKSASGSGCLNTKKNVTATQLLSMVGGRPNWDASWFKTP